MIGASSQPTTLGDIRATSLQAGGLFGMPPIIHPPFTLSTGGGGPVNALTINGVPLTIFNEYLTIGAAQ